MTHPPRDEQTRVCVLTPQGRGAIAVVAVQGPDATSLVDQCFLAKNRRPLHRQQVHRIVYGNWNSPHGEDLVLFRPSDDEVEIHCHGGTQSIASVVRQLVDLGCHEIPWQAWIAYHHACRLAVEAQVALAEATTSRTALILLDQFQGALRGEVEALAGEIQGGALATASSRLQELLTRVPEGLHLTSPWKVVLAGRPNVGKSSIINALVGFRRTIVFDQPGTTRDVVSTNTVIEGWPIQLSDTAGLHATSDPLEAAGIQLARTHLTRADLVIWVEDAAVTEFLTPASALEVLNQIARELQLELPEKQLVVLNKIDLRSEPFPPGMLTTNALSGKGIDELLSAIIKQLVPRAPAPGVAVPFTKRQATLLEAARESCESGDSAGALAALHELLRRAESIEGVR